MPAKTKTTKTVHRCSECGCETPRWLGRCPECDAWGTLGEAAATWRPPAPTRRVAVDGPVPIGDVDARAAAPCPPGWASSTGCSAAGSSPARSRCSAASRAWARARCCSRRSARLAGRGHALPARLAPRSRAAQVRLRAERLGALAARPARRGRDVAAARPRPRRRRTGPTCSRSTRSRPSSIPTCPARRARSRQVRDGAYRLVQHAKEHGRRHGARRPRHQGRLARRAARARARRRHRALVRGRPRTTRCALLRALKHRFGATDELGLFEMTEHGLWPRARPVGACSSPTGARARRARSVAAVLEGARPLLVEVQALVDAHRGADAAPRRARASTSGASRCCSRCSSGTPAVDARRRRRLRQRRRRRARRRAGRRPRASRSRSPARSSARGHRRATRSRSARSASAARCAGPAARAPARRGGAPRVHAARWCPRACADAPVAGLELRRGDRSAARRGGARR